MNLTIISEAYHPSHFQAFDFLNENKRFDSYSIIAINVLLKRNPKEIPEKIFQMVKLLFNNDYCLIASAPLSPLIVYYALLKVFKKNKLINYSSWPYWQNDIYRWNKLKTFFKPLWLWFVRDIYHFCINTKAFDYYSSVSNKAFLIPHSIDTKIFFPQKRHKQNNKLKCLFVGKLISRKGIKTIIQVARELPDVEFLLVGDGVLLNSIINTQLANIKYLGIIKDKKKLRNVYNDSDIFILPSLEEFFGVALIEAMACKLPVIATDCIGPKNIIENKKDGLIVNRDNPHELKKAILLLKNNKKLLKELRENAYKKVLKKYSVEVVSKKILNVLMGCQILRV